MILEVVSKLVIPESEAVRVKSAAELAKPFSVKKPDPWRPSPEDVSVTTVRDVKKYSSVPDPPLTAYISKGSAAEISLNEKLETSALSLRKLARLPEATFTIASPPVKLTPAAVQLIFGSLACQGR